MTRTTAILASLACITLAGCESALTTEKAPEQRLDVSVTNDTPQRATPVVEQAEPTTTPAAQTRDAAIETVSAPAPTRAAPPPASAQPPQQWWLKTPDPVQGRIRVVAKGGGATLPEARQAAVDAGRAELTRLRGSAPEELEFEKTQAFPRAGGVYEAFVLISCER